MTIKTFHPQHSSTEKEFYIQSRGLHSGRPLRSPIPNCFVVICHSPQEKEEYFNIVQALFFAKAFSQYIGGSVVPMIRIKDVRNIVQYGVSIRDKNPEKFQKTHDAITKIDALVENTYQKLDLLEKLKCAQLNEFFNGR